MLVATTLVFGTKHTPFEPLCQISFFVLGLLCLPTNFVYTSICASSSTSSTSYLQAMTCSPRCSRSSPNTLRLTFVHWASPQATGRTNHSGALKAKVNISRWGDYNHPIFSFSITFPISLSSLILTFTSHIFVSVCPRSFRPLAIVLSSELRD